MACHLAEDKPQAHELTPKKENKVQKEQHLDENCYFFSAEKVEEVLILRFLNNFLPRSTDLNARDTVLDYIDRVSKNDSIKLIMIIGSPVKKGRDEYIEFFQQVLKSKMGLNAIHRMCNVVNQFILKIVDSNKFVVHVNSGNVISLLLNISLACDYRIVADNTIFQNPYFELGVVPKGGGAFFLPKMLGFSKAYEILLSARDITAQEALRLGIVDKVVPFHELEEVSLKTAKGFGQKPAHLLSGIKRLINYSIKDLEDYLKVENEMLLRIVESPEFWEKIAEHNQNEKEAHII